MTQITYFYKRNNPLLNKKEDFRYLGYFPLLNKNLKNKYPLKIKHQFGPIHAKHLKKLNKLSNKKVSIL